MDEELNKIKEMNSIAKAAVSSKLSSVSKGLGLDDKDKGDVEGPSAKELRKIEEENTAARAKLQEQHAKQNAERQKKREEIRAKYGLTEGQGKNSRSGSTRRNTSDSSADTDMTVKKNSEGEGKQCSVM